MGNRRKLRHLERNEADARANGKWKSENEVRGLRIGHILDTVDSDAGLRGSPKRDKAFKKSNKRITNLVKKYEKERDQRKKEFASEYGEDVADREFAKTERPS